MFYIGKRALYFFAVYVAGISLNVTTTNQQTIPLTSKTGSLVFPAWYDVKNWIIILVHKMTINIWQNVIICVLYSFSINVTT